MQIATNPQTGERLQWNGSAWVPMSEGAPVGRLPVLGPPPKPPAPRDPLAQELDRVQIAKGQADLSMQPYDVQGKALDLEAKQLDIEAKRKANAQGPQMTDDQQKLAAKRASLDSLVEQINRVDELYRKGFKDEALGIISSIGEYLPSDKAAEFNAAGAGLAEQGLAAFRVPGVGSQSDTELRQFVEANKPSSMERDTANEEKLRQLRLRVDAQRQAMGLPPAKWLEADRPDYSLMTEGGNSYTQEAATGDTKTEFDPEGTALLDGMIRKGVPYGLAMREFRQRYPGSPLADPKVYRQAVEHAKAHPDYKGSYGQHTITTPISGIDQTVNAIGQSAPGAYAVRAANALTANNLDSIVGATGGDAEVARYSIDEAGRNNPVASTVGDLSGSVLGAIGLEGGLAARGMGAGFGRSMLADSAYGAAAGAGAADNGNRLGGAATGALSAGAGSIAGRGIARGASAMVSPTGGRLADLYAAGVRPSIGQRVVNANGGQGLAGMAGRAINGAEEALQSVPIVGAAISGTRQRARDQFQVGAFNQALAEIGDQLPANMAPGTNAHRYAQQAFNRAYTEARQGMRVVADEELANQLGELAGEVGLLAEGSAQRFGRMFQSFVARRVQNGELSGQGFQRAHSDIGKQIRSLRNMPSGDGELAQALERLQGILDDAARRHSDPDAVALLDGANAGYSRLVRIEDAARRRGGDDGTFTPTQFSAAVQNMSGGRGARGKQHLRGDALMQDYAQQGMALADRMPNSGTTDRALVAGTVGAGAAGYLEPSILGFLGAIGGAYAPGVRNVTTGVMAPRGPRAQAIARRIRERTRLLGATGAGLALSAQKDPDQ